METKTLFPSENAYRIAAALLACTESNMTEVLIPDIARAAKVNYCTALYWIDIFEVCGYIHTHRYDYRKNAQCHYARHIIIHLDQSSKVKQIYNYMWIQSWENNLMQDLHVYQLQLIKKAA
jgi:hypothetical protein